MRVALVTTSYPAFEGDPSGHFVQAEARELERAGHTVIVVRPEAGGAFGWPGVAARVRERPFRAVDAMRWMATARSEVAGLSVGRVVAHWAVPCGWPVATAAAGAELEIVSHAAGTWHTLPTVLQNFSMRVQNITVAPLSGPAPWAATTPTPAG